MMERDEMYLVNEAILTATEAHAGQVRKGTKLPYIVHPVEAMAIVATMTDEPEVLAAMVLHDVVEDTSLTMEDIRVKFGERVAKLVAADTENKRADRPAKETWKVRKRETLDFVEKEATREEKMVVLGDKLSNMRAMYRDYKKYGDVFFQKFAVSDKKEQGWYYGGFVERMKEFEGYPVYQEYKWLVKEVFGSSF